MTNVSLSPGERAAYANGLEDGQKLQKRPVAWRVGPLSYMWKGGYALYSSEAAANAHLDILPLSETEAKIEGLYLRDGT